jgi:hypothetical protein
MLTRSVTDVIKIQTSGKFLFGLEDTDLRGRSQRFTYALYTLTRQELVGEWWQGGAVRV